MRIATWNVNGLRAVLGKGALDWIRSEPVDVLCLQEIKSRPEQLNQSQIQTFDGFQAIWNPAERPGYSGVATFSAVQPRETRVGIEQDLYDCEGRVIATRFEEFWLFNIYFPSGQRGQDRVQFKLDFYAEVLKILDQLHAAGEAVVVCGDFNTAHQEIDLRNPKQNVRTSGFLPEERAWIDIYLAHGLTDAYRTLYPEKVEYTWWTYRMGARQRNIGWRLDYFLISAALMPRVQDVTIRHDLEGSDHCPVILEIDAR